MKNCKGKLQRVGDSIVCMATHPDFPNYDGRSRSRVRHLTEPDAERFAFPATRCGMLVVEYMGAVDPTGGICKQCSRLAPQPHAATKDKGGWQ